MKFLHVLTLLLVTLVAYNSAERCIARPRIFSCAGALDVGHSGPRCTPRNMWHYDARTRQCHQMRYLGCGGNNNRWCTLRTCQLRCRR